MRRRSVVVGGFDDMRRTEAAVGGGRCRRTDDEEHRLQCACVGWFRLSYPKFGGLLFAVPNGGRRDKVTGARLKAEGVVAGVSDLLLLVARGGSHGLCVEMKTPQGRQQQSQREWQRAVEAEGYRYAVCRSLEDFIDVVGGYLCPAGV